MDQNNIISNKVLRKINKIEKDEAKLKKEKDDALIEIRKQIPKDSFIEMIDKIIECGYSSEKVVVEEIKEKEAKEQKIEYDDYIVVLKMYDNIVPNVINK